MGRILQKESLFDRFMFYNLMVPFFLNFDSGSEIVFDNSQLYKKVMLAF